MEDRTRKLQSSQPLQATTLRTCQTCHGAGTHHAADGVALCETCRGLGKVRVACEIFPRIRK